MIDFKTLETAGFRPAIRGMRNAYKSKGDSVPCDPLSCYDCIHEGYDGTCMYEDAERTRFIVGEKDEALCRRLIKGGPSHRKYLRQIMVWADITLPRYLWAEFDTYRAGCEKNSESTVHTIMHEEISPQLFQLDEWDPLPKEVRDYIRFIDKNRPNLRAVKQLLPESFLQTRTCMLSYETLRKMYQERHNHPLMEWTNDFVKWCESLPYAWFICEK